MEQQYQIGQLPVHLSIKSHVLLGFSVSARGLYSGLMRGVNRFCASILLLNYKPSSALTHNYPSIDTQPSSGMRATVQVQDPVGCLCHSHLYSLRQ